MRGLTSKAVRNLYRVFNYLENAAPDAPGGPFFVPAQQSGRLDNPSHYAVLYCSEQPEAAVAEAFGKRPTPVWSHHILRGHPALPGSVRALATYRLSDSSGVCDLDDPRELVAQRLRPSRLITRDYETTQAWALEIYKQERVPRWSGVRWLSHYEGRWSSVGLWRRQGLALLSVERLGLEHAAIAAAAATIGRQLLR